MKICDLHAHTHFSDGTFSPTELVNEAKRVGLSAVALTDHNNLGGAREFLTAIKGTGIDPVVGVEFSTDYGEKVLFTVAVKKAEGEVFQAELVDYMQGRVDVIGGAEYYAPFKE